MREEDKYAVLKEKRKWLLGGLLIGTVLFFLLDGEEAEPSAGEVTVSAPATRQEAHRTAVPKRILGAEKAAQGESLADPFSIAHLTREEMEQAKLVSESRQQEGGRERPQTEFVPMKTESPKAMVKQEQKEKKKEDGISLQGIVTGEHGRMAILKQDGKSVSIAVGEKIGERILTEIGDRGVVFADGERMTMQIP